MGSADLGAMIRSASELPSDVDELRLALLAVVGDRYRVRASDEAA